jgi:hypothetical protein
MKQYFWNILISIDQLANTVLGVVLNLFLPKDAKDKFGNPDETLSSVFGKNIKEGKCKWCYYICKILHIFDKNHCKKSIEK